MDDFPLTNPSCTRQGKEQTRVSGGDNTQPQESSIGCICRGVQGKNQGVVPWENGGFSEVEEPVNGSEGRLRSCPEVLQLPQAGEIKPGPASTVIPAGTHRQAAAPQSAAGLRAHSDWMGVPRVFRFCDQQLIETGILYPLARREERLGKSWIPGSPASSKRGHAMPHPELYSGRVWVR